MIIALFEPIEKQARENGCSLFPFVLQCKI
jgi:hypothetical protein